MPIRRRVSGAPPQHDAAAHPHQPARAQRDLATATIRHLESGFRPPYAVRLGKLLCVAARPTIWPIERADEGREPSLALLVCRCHDFRSSFRQTTFKPDQSSSIAATFTSTRPRASAASRIAFSVTSLTCPAALRGQATHSAPAGTMRGATDSTADGVSAAERTNCSARRHCPRPPRQCRAVAARPGPSQPGHQTRRTQPGFRPSLRACGVAE